ncbi:ATP-binding response regulator [Aporhodopirellula aestuarii]|uniref:histidine kinase n=1 Tax=Aporhodopirellula aestuarii TaxID=2950107 RepID=A0ABT0U507_9BACT|nr:ATP-binding protein [Aporhodopirellula aestuarii]MCM2371999.1 ATP-binding protein [Aporhodopirellula aestuarii]
MSFFMIDRHDRSWSALGCRYGTAILSTGVMIWVRSLLQPWLKEECPFSLFYLSVLLTAWIAGIGPAVLAIALGTFAAAYFFILPTANLWVHHLPDLVQLVIYVFVNCVAIFLFERAERERRLAETRSEENQRLSDDLRRADIRKDEFLALLAHELRNPLAPIRSSLVLLERKVDSPDVVRRVRDVIHRQTLHLIRLTEDLLDVSRFCQGKVELQVCRMDLRKAVRDAIEMVESSFESKAQRFEALLPEQPVWIEGDRVRLAQLTANLLCNASKYTPETGRVVLHLEQIDDAISLVVTDNGIGFDPDQADRILEPFVQMDGSRTREYGGLGVGLTIVNRLVALHHGQLSAHSRGPGMGSCFSVTLPVAESSADEDSDANLFEPAEQAFDVATQDLAVDEAKRQSLLLVDDNADATAILAELFRFEGFQVEIASDGFEAVQLARSSRPDVIVMDIGLPGMDGYETARRILRSQPSDNLRMIALTGWGRPADRVLAAEAGFHLHLIKPVAFRELLGHVRHVMAQQESSKAERPLVST